jgi:hypothetical protein
MNIAGLNRNSSMELTDAKEGCTPAAAVPVVSGLAIRDTTVVPPSRLGITSGTPRLAHLA